METVYKVVRRVCDEMVSCCMNECFPEAYRVKYQLGEKVTPVVPNTKLFVFAALELATEFARAFSKLDRAMLRILECHTEEAIEPACPYSCAIAIHNFDTYWRHRLFARDDISWTDRDFGVLLPGSMPIGTRLCDGLTPQKVVWSGATPIEEGGNNG